MWILLIITLVNGGEGVSKIQTRKYATQTECVQARDQAERRAATFGYCTYETRK
jgi:hypothetical protein